MGLRSTGRTSSTGSRRQAFRRQDAVAPSASRPMAISTGKISTTSGITPPATLSRVRTAGRGESQAGAQCLPGIRSRPATPRGSRAGLGRPAVDGSSMTVARRSSTSTTRRPVRWPRSGQASCGTTRHDRGRGTGAWYRSGCRTARWPARQVGLVSRAHRGHAPNAAGEWRTTACRSGRPGAQTAADWSGSSVAVLQDNRYPTQAMDFASWSSTNVGAVNATFLFGSDRRP